MNRLLALVACTLALAGCDLRTSIDLIFHRHGPEVIDEAHRVVHCESRGDPNAVSPGGGNHGAWQINTVHRRSFERVTGQPFHDGVYDPWWSTYFAHWLYEQQGWRPWTCAP